MKITSIFYMAVLLVLFMNRIATINRLKSEAKEAYRAGDYTTAIQKYTYLVDSLQVHEEEVILNLANAYFQAGDTTHAETHYRNLQQALTPDIRSISNQQLGVIAGRKSHFEQALNYFKKALKANPANEDARFNYELLMKKLQKKNQKDKKQQQKGGDKKDQDKKQQQKDGDKQGQDKKKQQKDGDKQGQDKKQQQKDGGKQGQDKKQQQKDGGKQGQDKKQQQKDGGKQGQDKQQQKDSDKQGRDKNQQQKAGDKDKQDQKIPSSVSDKLKKMNISEAKAKMILEAMKNSEIQYLQQKKRTSSKKKNTSKPDW